MRLEWCVAAVLVAGVSLAWGQGGGVAPQTVPNAPKETAAAVRQYVRVPGGGVVVLRDVRVIDGTGAAAREHQDVVIERGKIVAVGVTPVAGYAGAAVGGPAVGATAGVTVLELAGRTVFPGLVGMHDHMYYISRPDLQVSGHSEPPLAVPQMTFSSPLLYLGAGVTTMRTTGSVEPYTDLNVKAAIDRGELAGPHMDVTAPYLEGAGSPFIQMHPLRDAEDARRTVDFWADQGATSFKAYMNITRAELGAAIAEAHKRGLKVTGHLCSVTYPEAVELGIDDLEHGFFVNTQMDPGKQPDVCSKATGFGTMDRMRPGSPEAEALMKLLVEHHVAVTSTLPVFESMGAKELQVQGRVLDTMSPATRTDYLLTRNRELMRAGTALPNGRQMGEYFRQGMAMEREFVAAGGLLLAGPDPTGDGGVLPGFGDQREVELLVAAGFRPVEAIRIATLNGATYLGRADAIGTVAVGKNADLVVVEGDPSTVIGDVEKTEIVFKDGVGYDSRRLLEAVRGRYGQY